MAKTRHKITVQWLKENFTGQRLEEKVHYLKIILRWAFVFAAGVYIVFIVVLFAARGFPAFIFYVPAFNFAFIQLPATFILFAIVFFRIFFRQRLWRYIRTEFWALVLSYSAQALFLFLLLSANSGL